MSNIKVIYKGKEYIILRQDASGFCEILAVNETKDQIKLVHFSELVLNIKSS
ncbi:hypothetical protein [Bacillus sp. MRMR6]|uniref:hypothetical protein n=1 Tax=Bacillus sp. MRMR6 TaxID=1928617 RepID=UPI00158D4073|nr:hypothetical protein [Bacillus sp. MRMR6]